MYAQDLKIAFKEIQKKIQEYQISSFQNIEENGYNTPSNSNNKIEAIINSFNSKHSKDILTRIKKELLADGPITTLLEDSKITEIIINSPEDILYEKSNIWHKHTDVFLSEISFQNFVNKLSEDSNARVDLNTPCNNGNYLGFRIHIITPPLTLKYPCISIRKHPKNPWNFSKLLKTQWASEHSIIKIQQLISDKKNFLIIGPTGSGKTSILNACLQSLPHNERVICIEDTDELTTPNDFSTKLITRIDLNSQLKAFHQEDLLIESLRMRPERIIMGEIRGKEAKDFLLALATGHQGCMTSLHADSAAQALWRLEMLVQMGAPQWSLETIRRLIYLTVHAIIVLENQNVSQKRSLKGIYKISSLEDFGFLVDKDHSESF